MSWNPIGTAPKDGRMLLLGRHDVCFIGAWIDLPIGYPDRPDWLKPEEGGCWCQYRCITARGYNTAFPAEKWPIAIQPTHWKSLGWPPSQNDSQNTPVADQAKNG